MAEFLSSLDRTSATISRGGAELYRPPNKMASKFKSCSKTLNDALQTASLVLLKGEAKGLRRELASQQQVNAELLLELVDCIHELQHARALHAVERRVHAFFLILRT